MNHRTIHRNLPIAVAATLLTMTLAGCDDRAAQIAIDAADRQAEQNREMAQLNREVAQGTSRLVTEDAKAREQALKVHQQLQDERAGLRTGWDDLEDERRQIAQSRRTDSALAAIASGGGATLAALLALALAWLVLCRGQGAGESSAPALYAEVIDVMLNEPQPTGPQLPDLADPAPQLTHQETP